MRAGEISVRVTEVNGAPVTEITGSPTDVASYFKVNKAAPVVKTAAHFPEMHKTHNGQAYGRPHGQAVMSSRNVKAELASVDQSISDTSKNGDTWALKERKDVCITLRAAWRSGNYDTWKNDMIALGNKYKRSANALHQAYQRWFARYAK